MLNPDEDPMAQIESELFGEATNGQRAKRILDGGAVMAAATIVDLARNGQSERIRLTASQEILNRIVGPVGKDDAQDTLQEFLQSISTLAKQSEQR